MNQVIANMPIRFRFAGQEDVFFDVKATEMLPKMIEERGYQRVFIVSSRTLNRTTEVVRNLEKCLGSKHIGTTDKVGEHSPVNNVLAAAKQVRDIKADVLIAIGGGSVIDFTRFVQLCLTEEVYDKESLLAIQFQFKSDLSIQLSSTKTPAIRFICIPTTMSTAEWTLGGTPVIEETKLKARFAFKSGGPEIILYDPHVMVHTPLKLLLATAVRGLDHAINTRVALKPNPLADPMTDSAVKLFIENLPRIKKNQHDLEAMRNLQLATALSGLCQMQAIHGFSHWMVHIIGPYADVGHSEAACVCMVAQAKYFEGYADERYTIFKKSLGREEETFHEILEDLLNQLEMPTRFKDLGITKEQLDEMAPLAMEHPFLTRFNVRPIDTPEKVRAVLALGE